MKWIKGFVALLLAATMVFVILEYTLQKNKIENAETNKVELTVNENFETDKIENAETNKIELTVNKILILKSLRKMYLLNNQKTLREYDIALGFAPIGNKEKEGDGKTPEGIYKISGRNPNSQYHLSLRISYPDAKDRKRAAEAGVSPGGDIMIHGLPNKFKGIGKLHYLKDWTAGCIAVTNQEIEEIWQNVANGTEVEIRQ